MRSLSLSALLLGLGAALPAQGKDVLYYPFLVGSGTSVTNLWSGAGVGPKSGTIVNTNTTNKGWAKGVVGNALAGKDAATTLNYVDSGWAVPASGTLHTGSFTVAFFAKESWSQTNANELAYFFSGVGSFRMFTGGVAYEGFYCRAWGGADLILSGTTNTSPATFDFRAEAKKGWVHVALRVDEAADNATWFINGTPIQQTPLNGSKVNITGTVGSKFLVNMHTSPTLGSNYDLDDFRFTGRAAQDHEIAQWAMAKMVPDVTELSVSGATKTQNLQLDLGAGHAVDQYWLFGSITGTYPGTTLAGYTVPLNADPYTTLLMGLVNTPVFSQFKGILDAQGKAKAALNLPATTPASAVGVDLFHSAVIYDLSGNWTNVTNACRMRVVK